MVFHLIVSALGATGIFYLLASLVFPLVKNSAVIYLVFRLIIMTLALLYAILSTKVLFDFKSRKAFYASLITSSAFINLTPIINNTVAKYYAVIPADIFSFLKSNHLGINIIIQSMSIFFLAISEAKLNIILIKSVEEKIYYFYPILSMVGLYLLIINNVSILGLFDSTVQINFNSPYILFGLALVTGYILLIFLLNSHKTRCFLPVYFLLIFILISYGELFAIVRENINQSVIILLVMNFFITLFFLAISSGLRLLRFL